MQKLQTTTDLGMDTLSKFLKLLNNSFSCCLCSNIYPYFL